jgi:hypothetical protein
MHFVQQHLNASRDIFASRYQDSRLLWASHYIVFMCAPRPQPYLVGISRDCGLF